MKIFDFRKTNSIRDYLSAYIIFGVPGVLLLIAIFNLPYYYYEILRAIIFTYCIAIVTIFLYSEVHIMLVVYKMLAVLIALIFNPIFPISLPKSSWIPIDIICAIFFFSYMFIPNDYYDDKN